MGEAFFWLLFSLRASASARETSSSPRCSLFQRVFKGGVSGAQWTKTSDKWPVFC